MDPLVKTQYEVRQNADELQDFLRDLNQWKSEMVKKEKEIGCTTPIESNLPPIRGSKNGKSKIEVKDKLILKESQRMMTNREKRISGFDNGAWDKFDAEKACEEIDKEEVEQVSEDETSEPNEDMEEFRRREAAVAEKEKGNEHYRRGEIDKAIDCYTKGILCDPKNHILPANRALALLKKEMYAAAEQDCNLALNIDKNYVKAIQRRGISRMALKKFDGAKDDFRQVLGLEPGNKQAYDELMKIREIEKEQAEQKQQRLMQRSSSPPAQRIKIEEVNTELGSGDEVKKLGLVKALNKPPHLRSKKPLKRLKIQEMTSTIKDFTVTELPEIKKSEEITNELFDSEKNNVLKTDDVQVPSPPATLYQFQTTWKTLKNSKEKQYLYLKQIPAEKYATIFDDFLENEFLTEFLTIIQEFYIRDGEDIFMPLQCLAKAKRFQIISLFLSASDKNILKELFNYMRSLDRQRIDELEKLSELYQIKI